MDDSGGYNSFCPIMAIVIAHSRQKMLGKRKRKIRITSLESALIFVSMLLIFTLGCDESDSTLPPIQRIASEKGDLELSAEMEKRVELFCGDCHTLPNAASFARDRWHFEVKRGYEFYAKSGRNDIEPPPLQATLAYFRSRAPQQLTFPHSDDAAGTPPVSFKQEKLFLNSGVLPEIAHLRWTQLSPGAESVMLATDMRHGQVVAIDLKKEGRRPPSILAQLRNPGRVEICDLDNDGQLELIVGDLASYFPSDHDRGRIVMLQRRAGGEQYDEVELLTGMGRISDIRAAHVDGDDKLDLVIAEFGWRDTGRLLLAKNISEQRRLKFELQQIDDRPGALNVRLHDFSGDGVADLVALFSQEYESVDLYRNDGSLVGQDFRRNSRFTHLNLWQADDLTFGCSGMELVDLNQDGKMDLLFTNGDSFDNNYVTPWHGVQWLENQGGLKFVYHRLTEMPGAYSAQAGDFDRDGMLDIVVASRLPENPFPSNVPRFASIVFLHQRKPGVFDRYTLEWDSPFCPSLAIGDFDANGYLDFAVAPGPYTSKLRDERNESYYLTVWWNQKSDQQ